MHLCLLAASRPNAASHSTQRKQNIRAPQQQPVEGEGEEDKRMQAFTHPADSQNFHLFLCGCLEASSSTQEHCRQTSPAGEWEGRRAPATAELLKMLGMSWCCLEAVPTAMIGSPKPTQEHAITCKVLNILRDYATTSTRTAEMALSEHSQKPRGELEPKTFLENIVPMSQSRIYQELEQVMKVLKIEVIHLKHCRAKKKHVGH